MQKDECKMTNERLDTIIEGDCLEVMRGWPEGCIDAVVTDPPWPDCAVDLGWNPDMWSRAAVEMERLVGDTGKVILHLNSQTNPVPMLAPFTLPFVHVCWLRYIPPRYRGNILNCGDVAYQLGRGFLPKGRRVLGQECHSGVSLGKRDPLNDHPTPRNLRMVNWLIESQVGPGRIVLDPFCGSGTTCIAAWKNDSRFIGIEVNPKYAALARTRVARETRLPLFSEISVPSVARKS